MLMNTQHNSPAEQQEKKEKTKALLLTLLGAIYAISPLDIIPDIPIIGWIDDFFVLSAAILNLLEHMTGREHYTLRKGFKYAKWLLIIIGIIVIIILVLLGALIVNWLSGYF
jgi:hypothetical protein